VAGHDPLGPLDVGRQALERRQVRVAAAVLLQPRDLDGEQVVAAYEHARPPGPDRHAVVGVALGRQQLELLGADLHRPGHRQRLHVAQRQRPRALDVVLLVELPQRALGVAGLGSQSRHRRLRRAEGGLGERQAAQDVVPVAVRAQQARQRPAGLREDRRQRVELVLKDRRVDDEALPFVAQDRARGLPHLAAHDDDVRVQADGLHGAGPARGA
jgi:hypothetical protein